MTGRRLPSATPLPTHRPRLPVEEPIEAVSRPVLERGVDAQRVRAGRPGTRRPEGPERLALADGDVAVERPTLAVHDPHQSVEERLVERLGQPDRERLVLLRGEEELQLRPRGRQSVGSRDLEAFLETATQRPAGGVTHRLVEHQPIRAARSQRRAELLARRHAALDAPGVQKNGQPGLERIPQPVLDLDEGERHVAPLRVLQAHVPVRVLALHRLREVDVEAEQVLGKDVRGGEDGGHARRGARGRRQLELPGEHGAGELEPDCVRHARDERETRSEVQAFGVELVQAGDRGLVRRAIAREDAEEVGQGGGAGLDQRLALPLRQADGAHAVGRLVADLHAKLGVARRNGERNQGGDRCGA